MDNCGIGGDKFNSFNISIMLVFVFVVVGILVVKYGNRSIFSCLGSVDVC